MIKSFVDPRGVEPRESDVRTDLETAPGPTRALYNLHHEQDLN